MLSTIPCVRLWDTSVCFSVRVSARFHVFQPKMYAFVSLYFVCLSVCRLWTRLSVHLCQCIRLSVHLCQCIRLSVRVPICLSFPMSVCLSVRVSVCLSVCPVTGWHNPCTGLYKNTTGDEGLYPPPLPRALLGTGEGDFIYNLI